jgi:hypothetical protein
LRSTPALCCSIERASTTACMASKTSTLSALTFVLKDDRSTSA